MTLPTQVSLRGQASAKYQENEHPPVIDLLVILQPYSTFTVLGRLEKQKMKVK